MKRVLIVGCGGAGKSTLARRLGAVTGLPVVHLDREFWRPGWVQTEPEAWHDRVAELVARDAWIMDGNFGGTFELRAAAADTIVLVDRSRLTCLRRALWRAIRNYGRARVDMAPGCTERIDLEFLRWIWKFPRKRRPQLLARLDGMRTHKRIVTLRSDAEAARFVAASHCDAAPALRGDAAP